MADGHGYYGALNPYFAVTFESSDLTELTSALLLRWNNNLDLEPELVTEVPSRANGGVSQDFRRIILHLRENLHWSDGAPLTARDVVFTAHEMVGPGAGTFSDSWRELRSVRALDARTVEMVTWRADANFLSRYLFGGMRFILPEHLLAGIPLDRASAYNRMPIGAGPFRYVKADIESEIVLEANPWYWRGPMNIRRIVARVVPSSNLELVELQARELDMLANLSQSAASAARAIPGVRVQAQRGSYDMLNIMFNTSSPTGKDATLRDALRYATNRRQIAALLFHEREPVAEELFIPQDPMHLHLPFVEYDPRRARALLDGDGWHLAEDGIRTKNGRRLTIGLVVTANDGMVDKCVEVIRADWARVGVGLDVSREEEGLLLSPLGRLAKGTFDATIRSYTNGSSFFDFEIGCHRFPPHGFNFGRYCNPRVEQIFASLQRTDDVANRRRLYAQAQRIIEDSAVIINLAQLPSVFVLGPRLHHAHLSPLNFYDVIKDADVW